MGKFIVAIRHAQVYRLRTKLLDITYILIKGVMQNVLNRTEDATIFVERLKG